MNMIAVKEVVVARLSHRHAEINPHRLLEVAQE